MPIKPQSEDILRQVFWVMLNFLQVELHQVIEGQDCRTIGQSTIRMNEVLNYPSNKLHGSVIVYASATQKNHPAKNNTLGTLEYWFKLNASGQ